MTVGTNAFRAARDLLHRTEYDSARLKFAWPTLNELNWALDWFDAIAAEHPDRVALRIVDDADGDVSLVVARWLGGTPAATDAA